MVALAAAALLTPMVAPAGAAGPVSEPLATGLAGPLGLAVAPNGTVYVAQSFGDPEAGSPSTLTAVATDGTQTDLVSVADGEVAGIDVGAATPSTTSRPAAPRRVPTPASGASSPAVAAS